MQIPFVVDGQRVLVGDGAGGHGDDPVAGSELGLQCRRAAVGYVDAALQDGLRCALRHQRQLARWSRSSTETISRSWSNGSTASRV